MISALPPQPNLKRTTLISAAPGRARASPIPDTVPPRPEERAQPPAKRRSPETSLSTKVPQSVMQQLRRRYAETGVTIRNQILIALRKEGLEIDDDDIQDERKRSKR